MTIAEFLLERIAEDEEAAHKGLGEPRYAGYGETAADEVIGMGYNEGVARAGMDHFDRWMPARVLAECEARRLIVEMARAVESPRSLGERMAFPTAQEAFRQVLLALARPYADHPDFLPEWHAQ